MLQRWDRIYQSESELTQTLEQFLEENRLTPEELNGSQTLQQEFLLKMFPVCQQVAQNSEATGCFLLMTGESRKFPAMSAASTSGTMNPIPRRRTIPTCPLPGAARCCPGAWALP